MKYIEKILNILWIMMIMILLVAGITGDILIGYKKVIYVIALLMILLIQIYLLTLDGKIYRIVFKKYKNTVWVSDVPYFKINILEKCIKCNFDIGNERREAYIEIVGDFIECYATSNKEELYFYGAMAFEKDTCIIRIEEKTFNLFDEHNKIILKRE